MTSNSPVIILGMHRSGTSLLANLMQAIGVFMGDHLLAGRNDNPRGFFEDEAVLSFQVQLLSRIRSEHRFSPMMDVFQAELDNSIYVTDWTIPSLAPEELAQMKRLFDHRPKLDQWGWKDPRTCLFMEHWSKLYPEARILSVFRHPLEVYASLIRRGDIELALDEAKAIGNWCVYNREIIKCIRQKKHDFVLISAYEAIRDLAPFFHVVEDKLRIPFPEDTAQLESLFDAQLFRRLPISRKVHDLFCECFPVAGEVFEELQELSDIPFSFWDDTVPQDFKWVEENGFLNDPDTLLNLLCGVLSPSFNTEHKAFLAKASQKYQEYGLLLSASVPQMYKRMEYGYEVTQWRASYLVSKVASNERRSIYLWAANSLANAVRSNLEAKGIYPEGVIDLKEETAIQPDEFFGDYREVSSKPMVLICSHSAKSEISQALIENGWDMDRDCFALPTFDQPEQVSPCL